MPMFTGKANTRLENMVSDWKEFWEFKGDETKLTLIAVGNLKMKRMLELRRCNLGIPDPPHRSTEEHVDLEWRTEVTSLEFLEDINLNR